MTLSLAALMVQETKEAIYAKALSIATAIGLPVTSWQAGDPTRSLFHIESELLSTLESIVVGYVQSGFLDYATSDWLKILAKQVYNVDVPGATYATCDVVLTNTGGGVYDIDAGDITLKNSTTGKTYISTSGGHLGALGTLTVSVVAEEAGSSSSAGAGEIDAFVVGLLKVTCLNALAAVGIDEQDEAVTRQQCRDKLGSLSPNGPKDAYSYVARNPTLALTSAVTRVRVYSDSTSGQVTVYLAGASGGVSSPDRTLVETAIARYATPLCITPVVLSAGSVAVPITYEIWIYKSCNQTATEINAAILKALTEMFASRPVGGDIIPPATTGKLYLSMIESTIRATYPQIFRVVLTSPSGDTALTNGQVATLGTVTPLGPNLVVDP